MRSSGSTRPSPSASPPVPEHGSAPAGAPLSTSALAKRLKLPVQQLFLTLRDYGWIDRRGRAWALTAKGELHGGSYQDSDRYGRYIVWPESLVEHPMLVAIESNQRITPGAMRRYYGHLTTQQINQVLAELGLQRHSRQGIELTPLGARFGGRQDRDAQSGLRLISWPHEIVDHEVLHRELGRRQGDGCGVPGALPAATAGGGDAAAGHTGDLFAAGGAGAAAAPAQRCGVDGHRVDSILQLRVCDWLYGARLAHALQRALPTVEPLSADFYVPAVGLYIECWERDVPTRALTRRLRTREVCRELALEYLEIAADDIDRLDELLGGRLHALGAFA